MDAHVADWKKGEVKELTDLLTKNKVVGIIEVGGIPAPQMQQMRKNLQDSATIRSAKNNLIHGRCTGENWLQFDHRLRL